MAFGFRSGFPAAVGQLRSATVISEQPVQESASEFRESRWFCDTHGNVWEWVGDRWEPTYYSQFSDNPAINPSGPSSVGILRVFRGGGWSNSASYCRSSNRYATAPASRFNDVGFRVALVARGIEYRSLTSSRSQENRRRDHSVAGRKLQTPESIP